MRSNVYLAGGVRTPFGIFGGSLASVPAPRLGSIAISGALARAGVKPTDVDEVLMGNVIGAGLGQNVARQASLGADIGTDAGCTTINKVCGSSLKAIVVGAQAIQCGDADLVMAGGMESMSRAPYLLPEARTGYRMNHGTIIDAMVHDGLWDVYNDVHMGTCGDQCAEKYDISREDQDTFAMESYQRAITAWNDGFFADIVVPVAFEDRKKRTVTVERDEEPFRFDEGRLRTLRPAFGPEGRATAGNASGIADGATAIVVASQAKMKALDVKPDGRILGYSNVALEPEWFTIAPIHALRRLSEQLSLKLSNVDLFEINEAFSVVALVAIRELDLRRDKVNIHGGAVAMGHPIGATGARLVITLLHALRRTGGKFGMATLCIGGGEAIAMAVERCD
ncbi:MAG: thiolase family protein [Planctomycetes bacterium]|nr:thiolase family protein [Planctomycetota bacterium]